jgi:hypothetical protein
MAALHFLGLQMNYGLDLSSREFMTDREGKRLRVDMLIWLFNRLVESRNYGLRRW